MPHGQIAVVLAVVCWAVAYMISMIWAAVDELPEGGGPNRITDHAESLHRSAGAGPARQSGSLEVDPSGECQENGSSQS